MSEHETLLKKLADVVNECLDAEIDFEYVLDTVESVGYVDLEGK